MCKELIQELIEWMQSRNDHVIDFYVTSNEATLSDSNLVSYAKGTLDKCEFENLTLCVGSSGELRPCASARLSGKGLQAFNDRSNFDLSQRDSIELTIELRTPGNNSEYDLNIFLTLITWGEIKISLTGFHCQKGVLFAYAEGRSDRNGDNKVGYSITFKKVEIG